MRAESPRPPARSPASALSMSHGGPRAHLEKTGAAERRLGGGHLQPPVFKGAGATSTTGTTGALPPPLIPPAHARPALPHGHCDQQSMPGAGQARRAGPSAGASQPTAPPNHLVQGRRQRVTCVTGCRLGAALRRKRQRMHQQARRHQPSRSANGSAFFAPAAPAPPPDMGAPPAPPAAMPPPSCCCRGGCCGDRPLPPIRSSKPRAAQGERRESRRKQHG